MKPTTKLINVALSGLLAGALGGGAFAAEKKEGSKPKTASAAKGECHGINECKGKGDCGGEGHSCAGKNECSAAYSARIFFG